MTGSGRSRPLGIILIIVSSAAFGLAPIFGRFAFAAGVDTLTLLFLRFAISAAALVPVMWLRRVPLPPRRLVGQLLVLGMVLRVGQTLTYFVGLSLTTASLMSLLLYLYPALVALLSAVFLRERLTPLTIGAIVVALAGTTITVGPGARASTTGVILGVGTAAIYAVYILFSSQITPRAGALPSATLITLAAAVVYGVLAVAHGVQLPRSAGGWVAIVGIALISTVVGTLAFFAGMEHIGPTDASTLSTVEPAITVTLAVALLGEHVAPTQLFGGALILAAVATLARRGAREGKPAATVDVVAEP